MQHVIDARLTDSITLEQSEWFEVTGKTSEYHLQEKTIRVDQIIPISKYIGGKHVPAVRLHGKRVLKRGGTSDYRDPVDLPLDDAQIPPQIVEGVKWLTTHRAALVVVINDYKIVHGIR